MGKDREPIKSNSDQGLHGRVSGRNRSMFHRDREEELFDHVLGSGRDLSRTDTTDSFVGTRFAGGTVSLDNADAYQEGTGDYADGKAMTGYDGVLPCDLTGRPRDSKIGKSGKRTWDR